MPQGDKPLDEIAAEHDLFQCNNESMTTTPDSGFRADLDKKPEDIAQMFDQVAGQYDLTNDVLSLGQVFVWRQAVVNALRPGPGQLILDLAAGTGTSSNQLARTGAAVVACDLSEGMLEVGRQRYPNLEFVQGDATDLPFPDDHFDAVTISYGLRNVENPSRVIKEMLRVTRPGGQLLIAEFSTPTNPVFRGVYSFYLAHLIPMIARVVSSDADAYEYLMESIVDWPDQEHLADMIAQQGWACVAYRNLSGGAVALHRAFKP